ncbi:MAG: hypothetical protein MZV64_19355 [Ignavibacteriales bacterium]|nr:hypothetical protein [Ignavibacteriales bacterium]
MGPDRSIPWGVFDSCRPSSCIFGRACTCRHYYAERVEIQPGPSSVD